MDSPDWGMTSRKRLDTSFAIPPLWILEHPWAGQLALNIKFKHCFCENSSSIPGSKLSRRSPGKAEAGRLVLRMLSYSISLHVAHNASNTPHPIGPQCKLSLLGTLRKLSLHVASHATSLHVAHNVSFRFM